MHHFFHEAINLLFPLEGGFANDKDDRGGATRFGVTEQVAREHGYDGPMRLLPTETAIAIYKKGYWDPIKGDELAKASPALAYEVFEAAVNCGVEKASIWLQLAVNAVNIDRKTRNALFVDLEPDGLIGGVTLKAFEMAITENETLIYTVCNILQGHHYINLAIKSPDQRVWLRGWINKRITFKPETLPA